MTVTDSSIQSMRSGKIRSSGPMLMAMATVTTALSQAVMIALTCSANRSKTTAKVALMQTLTAGLMSTMPSLTTPFNGKIAMAMAGVTITFGSTIRLLTLTTPVNLSKFAIKAVMHSRLCLTSGRTWMAMVGVITKPVSSNLMRSHFNQVSGMTSTVMGMETTASMTLTEMKGLWHPRRRINQIPAAKSSVPPRLKNTVALTAMTTDVLTCTIPARGTQRSPMVC